MALSQDVQNILELVEQKTGYTVQSLPDTSLKVLAKVRMASQAFPVHVVTYNPSQRSVDYHIAFECGFILRLYDNPPNERYQFAASDGGRRLVQRAMASNKHIKRMGLPDSSVRQFANQLYDGLMTQLRSLPIGLRIDHWLWNEYPNLREMQRTSLAKQQQDNVQSLSPDIQKTAPATVWAANSSMNAAHALYCDRLLNQSQYFIPYRSAGLESVAERLLEIAYDVPADPSHDRELVDTWAEELNVSDWYEWIPLMESKSDE